jgi:transcription elongation GreA/GreB family factor
MSRAFVKETAEAAPPPERMVAEGPNLVTREGLAQIADQVARLEAALKKDPGNRETLERDLRYWSAAKASAQVAPRGPDGIVAFGSRVVIARKGREQRFRIVGEDEADPANGFINFRAPLATAIIGAQPGDVIEAGEPLGEIEIVSVEN